MITDLRAAELCAALYGLALPPIPAVRFETVDAGEDDGVCWALAREPGCDAIVLRGSVTPADWIRDSMAAPYVDRRLGPVHHGFFLGLDHAWADIAPKLRPGCPCIVTGHSLGAARAALLSGIMLAAGRPPARRVSFGEPKPGFAALAVLLRPIPASSYRNGIGDNHDIVTDLPLTIPPALNYVHPVALTCVRCDPDPTDGSGAFIYHHMNLYLAAVAAAAN